MGLLLPVLCDSADMAIYLPVSHCSQDRYARCCITCCDIAGSLRSTPYSTRNDDCVGVHIRSRSGSGKQMYCSHCWCLEYTYITLSIAPSALGRVCMGCECVCRAWEGVVSQGARAVPLQAGRQEGEVHFSACGPHGRHHQLF